MNSFLTKSQAIHRPGEPGSIFRRQESIQLDSPFQICDAGGNCEEVSTSALQQQMSIQHMNRTDSEEYERQVLQDIMNVGTFDVENHRTRRNDEQLGPIVDPESDRHMVRPRYQSEEEPQSPDDDGIFYDSSDSPDTERQETPERKRSQPTSTCSRDLPHMEQQEIPIDWEQSMSGTKKRPNSSPPPQRRKRRSVILDGEQTQVYRRINSIATSENDPMGTEGLDFNKSCSPPKTCPWNLPHTEQQEILNWKRTSRRRSKHLNYDPAGLPADHLVRSQTRDDVETSDKEAFRQAEARSDDPEIIEHAPQLNSPYLAACPIQEEEPSARKDVEKTEAAITYAVLCWIKHGAPTGFEAFLKERVEKFESRYDADPLGFWSDVMEKGKGIDKFMG